MTPYQKIMQAAYRGKGLTLSDQEVFDLSLDSAISDAAAIQDDREEERGGPLSDVFRLAEREAQLDESLLIDVARSPAPPLPEPTASQIIQARKAGRNRAAVESMREPEEPDPALLRKRVWLTPNKTAAMLGISLDMLAAWRKAHYGPKWQHAGPLKIRYDKADIEGWLRGKALGAFLEKASRSGGGDG